MDPELLERITARHAELDELEEQLAHQLAEVRAKCDELALAEKGLERMSGFLRPCSGPYDLDGAEARGALRQRGLHVP